MPRLAPVLLLTLLLASCTGGVPRPDAAMASGAGVDLVRLERGRSVYVSSCTGCHRLYATAEQDRDGWRAAVREMAPKARLDAGQRDDLLAYLLAASR